MNHLYFGLNFVFSGSALGRFSSSVNHGGRHFCSDPSHHYHYPKKASYCPETALNTVENKISSVSNLVKKKDYDAKIKEIENKIINHHHDKYVTIPEFNTLTVDVFNARLSQANFVTKQILMPNYQVLTKVLLQIKQNTYLLKMN